MCTCSLFPPSRVCGAHAQPIIDLFNELRAIEDQGDDATPEAYDRARHIRGALLGHGLKANIVIHQLTNGARQHA